MKLAFMCTNIYIYICVCLHTDIQRLLYRLENRNTCFLLLLCFIQYLCINGQYVHVFADINISQGKYFTHHHHLLFCSTFFHTKLTKTTMFLLELAESKGWKVGSQQWVGLPARKEVSGEERRYKET